MKSLFIKAMAYSMFILLFTACKKDEKRVVAGNGTAPALTTITATSLVLLEKNAATNAATFNWTASSFGFEGSVVTYAVQVAVAGNNFATLKEVSLGAGLTKTFTVAELNSLVNQLKLTPDVSGKVELRTKASISDKYAPAYSNVVTLTVNPYRIIIDYPSLYVPGSYQGWTPKDAAKVSSVDDNGIYEGYAYFGDASTEFKFTSAPDFDHVNYGTSAAGKLNAGGGDNLKVTGAGYYLLNANTNTLTYAVTKTTWAVMGTATGGTETAMVYDPIAKVWTVTKALSAGTLKFRANGSDVINFGSAAVADGTLISKGTAIPVATAGTYKITFNVSIPGNYIYTLAIQ